MKKKMFLVILTVVLLCSLSACGSDAGSDSAASAGGAAGAQGAGNTQDGEKLFVGCAMDNVADFDAYIVNGLQAYANQNADAIRIEIANADYDSSVQLRNVENFLTNGADAIVLKAVDREACGAISDLCVEANVPLVVITAPINAEYTSLVGSDQVIQGELVAEYLAEQLGGKGNVAILLGYSGNDATYSRLEGTKSVFEKYPDITIVAEQAGDWYRDQGMEIAENWIQSGLEIDAVLAQNDEMLIGAMMAFEDANLRPLMGGVDALPEACSLLDAGRIDVSISGRPFVQGSTALETAIKAINGEEVSEFIEVPSEIVTQENAAGYLDEYDQYGEMNK